MGRNMREWLNSMRDSEVKKAIPVLSFPCIQLMDITVKELISDSDLQAKGMKAVADRTNAAAAVSMMDLSVEAEAFGSTVRVSDDEVPTIIGSIVNDEDEAEALVVPEVGAGRTGLYLEAIEKACKLITDRPVFAGVIGPFSLSGRLMDVTEIMVNCYAEPDMVHTVMEKATEFLIKYIGAYRDTGANGVVMAEPLTGMLSPDLAAEFSEPYVRRIIEAVQTDDFIVIYHNCGDNTIQMIDSILRTKAAAFHFGNAISMAEMMTHIPSDIVAMGNVDPAGEFKNGTPASIETATLSLLEQCSQYPNFVVSSGCDIPPMSSWDNIGAFFKAVDGFYAE